MTIQISLNEDLQRDDWRAVAAALGEQPQEGRALVVTSEPQIAPLEHYLPGLTEYPADGATIDEIVAVEATREGASREPALPAGFTQVERRREPSFELARYRSGPIQILRPAAIAELRLDDEAVAIRLQPRGYPRNP